MFIITEWESNKLPLISLNFYRGWFCIISASMTFLIYDIIFRYLSVQFNFLLLWLITFYDVWNFDDIESDQTYDRAFLGLGDFTVFNFMLLLILPPSSSTITKIYITIGHIIVVQIAQELTDELSSIYNQSAQPGVPLPVIFVSLYFILLNIFIEY
ncbi:hypothetical protein I4U23_030152 [Adineta vaga]|nr:hypothetical protein I4U23_030152 [Adineta vaga]